MEKKVSLGPLTTKRLDERELVEITKKSAKVLYGGKNHQGLIKVFFTNLQYLIM